MTENHWKLTAIGLMLVIATALVTGLVVANWSGNRADQRAATIPPPPSSVASGSAPAAPAPAPSNAPPVQNISPVPRPATPAAPRAAAQQPASGHSLQASVDACNQYAATQTGQRDKATEIVKDGAIGAIAGAALGAASGAIAGGGSGAGKGAAVGGLVGAGGGSLYGINENQKRDQQYRDAYARCMHDRGYTG